MTPLKYAADDSVCALQIFAALMRKHGEAKVLEKVLENIEVSRHDLLVGCPVKNRIGQKCEFLIFQLFPYIFLI